MAVNKVDYEVLTSGVSVYANQAEALDEVIQALVKMNGELQGGWTNQTADCAEYGEPGDGCHEAFCCWQGSECDSRHWKCSDRCNRISADQCSDGAKQFWRSNRDPSVADWSRTDYPLWKSFSGLSFSGCDCTANF